MNLTKRKFTDGEQHAFDSPEEQTTGFEEKPTSNDPVMVEFTLTSKEPKDVESGSIESSLSSNSFKEEQMEDKEPTMTVDDTEHIENASSNNI